MSKDSKLNFFKLLNKSLWVFRDDKQYLSVSLMITAIPFLTSFVLGKFVLSKITAMLLIFILYQTNSWIFIWASKQNSEAATTDYRLGFSWFKKNFTTIFEITLIRMVPFVIAIALIYFIKDQWMRLIPVILLTLVNMKILFCDQAFVFENKKGWDAFKTSWQLSDQYFGKVALYYLLSIFIPALIKLILKLIPILLIIGPEYFGTEYIDAAKSMIIGLAGLCKFSSTIISSLTILLMPVFYSLFFERLREASS